MSERFTLTVMAVFAAVSGLIGCSERQPTLAAPEDTDFSTEVLLKTTPVKQQRNSELCWAYAMLATIETEHLMQGDSVNLSPEFTAFTYLREQAEHRYLTHDRQPLTTRGMLTTLIHQIMTYGTEPYSSFQPREDVNYHALCRKLELCTDNMWRKKQGIKNLRADIDRMMEEAMGPVPRYVFMLGCEYTPEQFARSVCRQREYEAVTSFTHQPYGQPMCMESPDNYYRDAARNVPLDTLLRIVETQLRTGHPVCWEGDISEPGFLFEQGIAEMPNDTIDVTAEMRQKDYERFLTTDDHCMEIIGIARNRKGYRYYICKNSWGKDNPYGGLMYMSENYLKMKTLMVVVKKEE